MNPKLSVDCNRPICLRTGENRVLEDWKWLNKKKKFLLRKRVDVIV